MATLPLIAAASQLKLAAVFFSELADKPVRINEVMQSAHYTIIVSIVQCNVGGDQRICAS